MEEKAKVRLEAESRHFLSDSESETDSEAELQDLVRRRGGRESQVRECLEVPASGQQLTKEMINM